MARGRPPSTKTLVDRQLGRNLKQPIIPAGESYMVPNHSGITSHPEMLIENIKTTFTDGSIPFSNGTNLIENNSDFSWNDANSELKLFGDNSSIALEHLEGRDEGKFKIICKNNKLVIAEYLGREFELIHLLANGNLGVGQSNPSEKLSVSGNLSLPITSGNGIKIGNTTPTFGWRDLLGELVVRNTGATKPNFVNYRDNLEQYQFAAGEELFFNFHIPHDYVPGTDIFIHVHWSHTSTLVTGGTLVFNVESSYSKGHNQAAFPASVNGDFTGTASTTQYQHIISEAQLSASSPTGLQIDTDNLEPDGVILMKFQMKTNSMTSSGAVPDPFIHYVDIHYQSTNIATKDKAPDFYT